MVKGVNRTVIEVNDTGNKYFSRVVFFINPEYSALPQGKLENRAKEYIGTLDMKHIAPPENGKHREKPKFKKLIIPLSVGAALITAATLIAVL